MRSIINNIPGDQKIDVWFCELYWNPSMKTAERHVYARYLVKKICPEPHEKNPQHGWLLDNHKFDILL